MNCEKEYDYKQLLLDCGLSTTKANQLARSLKSAIKKQNLEIERECSHKKASFNVKNKNVNEVIDLRKEKKEI